MRNDEGRPWDILERTKKFALRIVRLYGALPKTTEAQVIGKQLLRSGTSVGAQLREGKRSRSDAEMISKTESALQELEETGYWLEFSRNRNRRRGELTDLKNETDQLTAILVTSAKSLKSRPRVTTDAVKECIRAPVRVSSFIIPHSSFLVENEVTRRSGCHRLRRVGRPRLRRRRGTAETGQKNHHRVAFRGTHQRPPPRPSALRPVVRSPGSRSISASPMGPRGWCRPPGISLVSPRSSSPTVAGRRP